MPNNKHSLLVKEIDIIRNELAHLKSCQLSYVLAGVSASGAAAAYLFGSEVAAKVNAVPSILFLPGAISLPFWCTYFDKAVTVTRIVGYCRVIERILLCEMEGKKAYPTTFLPSSTLQIDRALEYKGWENSVKEYRDDGKYPVPENRKESKDRRVNLDPIGKFFSLLFARAEYNYWVFSWITFMMICLTTVAGAVIANNNLSYGNLDLAIIASVAISMAASMRYNTVTLYRLVFGKYSYGNREHVWEQVLSDQANRPVNTAQSTGPAPR